MPNPQRAMQLILAFHGDPEDYMRTDAHLKVSRPSACPDCLKSAPNSTCPPCNPELRGGPLLFSSNSDDRQTEGFVSCQIAINDLICSINADPNSESQSDTVTRVNSRPPRHGEPIHPGGADEGGVRMLGHAELLVVDHADQHIDGGLASLVVVLVHSGPIGVGRAVF